MQETYPFLFFVFEMFTCSAGLHPTIGKGNTNRRKKNTSTKCIDMSAILSYYRQPYEIFSSGLEKEGMGDECSTRITTASSMRDTPSE